MVIVELFETPPYQVERFDEELSRLNWTRASERPLSYCAEMQGEVSDDEAMDIVHQHFEEAAESAGVYEWDAVCLLSDSVHPIEPTAASV